MDIIVKTFAELTTLDLYEIFKARFAVFVMEQRCFYLDMDDIDYDAIHIFCKEGNEVIAYARLFPDRLAPEFEVPRSKDANAWHIGRLLTRKRGIGLGRTIIEKVISTAHEQGATLLRMEAQTHAIGLYEKFGFKVISCPFDDAGIEHVEMEKRLFN